MINYNYSEFDTPRPVLIKTLKRLIDDAMRTPINELCRRGDYSSPDSRYPQTKGEHIANAVTDLLITQSWVDGVDEPMLDDVLEVAIQLDGDVNQPEVWQELFEFLHKIQ